MKRHNSSNLLISHLKNEGHFFVFFIFLLKKRSKKRSKKGSRPRPWPPLSRQTLGVFFKNFKNRGHFFWKYTRGIWRRDLVKCRVYISRKKCDGQDGQGNWEGSRIGMGASRNNLSEVRWLCLLRLHNSFLRGPPLSCGCNLVFGLFWFFEDFFNFFSENFGYENLRQKQIRDQSVNWEKRFYCRA